MAQSIALMAPTAALGLFGASSHEPFDADGGQKSMAVTERSGQTPPQRRRNLPWSGRTVEQVVALPNSAVLGMSRGRGRPAPLAHHRTCGSALDQLQALLDAYRHYYNTRRHHTAVKTTPRRAWDTAAAHGGPGRLPRQDDATVHALTVRPNGTISLGGLGIYISTSRAGTKVTAIRDHDRVTVYTPAGDPLGHIRLDHGKYYQGTITPAA